jgi:arylsulfatase A-like enzyme
VRPRRPNLLFIITDHHAFHGHHRPGQFDLTMPRFERLAAGGARFDRAYSACPICSPARASMMTGVFPSAHGMRWNTDGGYCQNRNDLAPGQLLYSHYLSSAGYRNAYVGKWHVGKNRLPIDYGIEGWSLPDYGTVYMSEAYQHYAAERGLGDARALVEHNVDHPDWEGRRMVLHDASPWTFMNSSGILEGPPEAHEEQFVAHLAVEKLRELAATGQPFSLVASFWGPHQPYFPTKPFASMFDPASIPEHPSFRDPYRDRPHRHYLARDLHHSGVRRWRDWSIWQQVLARCYGQIMQLDAAVGTILDSLDELGIATNTLVVYCADHGDAVASHDGLWDKASTCIEEVLRVPMAIRWPAALPGGTNVDRLVSNMDATATLLEAAGVAVPDGMHSRSLLGLCREPVGAAWPDETVCEHNGHGHGEDVVQRVILHERWKYVAALYDRDELYDLAADPWELSDLARSPAHVEVKGELRARLRADMERRGDRPGSALAHLLALGL